MSILSKLRELFKGGNHAGRVGANASGRGERDRRIVHLIPSVREQAISDFGGIRLLARTCATERSGDFGPLSEDPIWKESCALIAAAKKVGCFLELTSVPGTRYTIRTGESEVRLVQKDRLYYKIKNPFAKVHLKKHPIELVLFEHIVHNVLFPECRLEFMGITEDCREARLVLRQEAVRSDTRPDDRQIAEELVRRGLFPEGRYGFGNDNVFVTDVGQDGDNVLVDDDACLRFIDPIISFKSTIHQALWNSLDSDAAVEELVNRLYDLSAATLNL